MTHGLTSLPAAVGSIQPAGILELHMTRTTTSMGHLAKTLADRFRSVGFAALPRTRAKPSPTPAASMGAKASTANRYAAGRADERKRCAAIFTSPHATRNLEMAAELAFSTDMAAEAALAHLRRMPSADRAARMAQGPRVSIAQSWDAAFQKAGASVPDALLKASVHQPEKVALQGAKQSAADGWDEAMTNARHQTSTNH